MGCDKLQDFSMTLRHSIT